MRTLSVDQLKRHFADCGVPVTERYGLDELRWRLYQWRKLGLMYFAEAVDRLMEEGEIEACTLIPLPEETDLQLRDTFVPAPFPILADAYEYLHARHQIDRDEFLRALAYFKLCHEQGASHADFESDDEYGLYRAFIDRFYASEYPYKGKKIYWILFDDDGVNFFSREFDLPSTRLRKFLARKRPPGARPTLSL